MLKMGTETRPEIPHQISETNKAEQKIKIVLSWNVNFVRRSIVQNSFSNQKVKEKSKE